MRPTVESAIGFATILARFGVLTDAGSLCEGGYTMHTKYPMALLAILAVSSVFAGAVPAAATGSFKCQDKGSMNFGTCKNLGHGMCSITVGDGTTVKMKCKDLRHV